MKRTKIVVTLGPATSSPEMIENLIREGVNVFRLNFSHGDHNYHLQNIKMIKEIREKLNCPAAILQDLSGPKVRLQEVSDEPLVIDSGDEIILDASLKGPSQGNRVGITYDNFAKDMAPDARLLLSDGDIELKVTKVNPPKVYCRTLVGGELFSRKGVNFPTGSFSIPAVTKKDEEDLRFGLSHGVDLVALSFVRSAADLELARRIMKEVGRNVPLIAKIEKHEAIANLGEILDHADGAMVARGDLGVEIDIEMVPMIQKRIISLANQKGKPVITATQMLKSMVDSPRPTRAEVTDVANAILDGTDAVMLSEETAIGKYPVRAVRMMAKIAENTEKHYPYYHSRTIDSPDKTTMVPESVAHSAVLLAKDIDAAVIIAATRSGFTARTIAKFRPCSQILALTPNAEVYYQMAVSWGVIPSMYSLQIDTKKLFEEAPEVAKHHDIIAAGDRYVITSGFPLGKPGSINQIKAGTYSPE